MFDFYRFELEIFSHVISRLAKRNKKQNQTWRGRNSAKSKSEANKENQLVYIDEDSFA